MVEVTQADREAAASVAVLPEMRELILAGRADHHAEPFARHRTAAMEAGARMMQEAAADWLRGISDPGATFQDRRLAYQLAASQFAEEIAALDPAEVVKGKP